MCLSPAFQPGATPGPTSFLTREAFWTPLLLGPPSQPQPTHLAPARFLPSTCLQSFTASLKPDPCSTNHLSCWGGISCLDSHLICKLHVSLSFLVDTDCYRLTVKAGLLTLKECKAIKRSREGKEMELIGGGRMELDVGLTGCSILNLPQLFFIW